nr:SIS domain-containing protein [Phenylobacterium aquaticum]
MAEALAKVRDREGRLFLIGVGGSAGHASHATNDFRKICGFEAYCPTDNVSELTARINDEGWEGSFSAWLEGSRLRAADGLLIFSVGGGSVSPPVSANIVRAIQLAKAAAPRSPASSAAAAAIRPRPLTPVWSFPPSTPN